MRHPHPAARAATALALVVAVLLPPLAAGAAARIDRQVTSGTPQVIRAIGPSPLNVDLRDLPSEGRIGPRRGGYVPVGEPPAFAGLRTRRHHPDRVAIPTGRPTRMMATQDFTTPERSWEGQTGGFPTDPNGDIGPNHYIQMVNTTFRIYDKDGNSLLGPTNINQIWDGFGGQCEDTNRGDPIVLYDQLADRWLLSQFAFDRMNIDADPDLEIVPPWFECVAISQGPNPVTDGWFRYAIQSPDTYFPDYPKLGIWPDAYYLTTVQTGGQGGGNYALDRVSMLAGGPANAIYFDTHVAPYNDERLLPVDMEGFTSPGAGDPGLFMRPDDTNNDIEIWEFQADFGNPMASTFGLAQSIGTAFDSSAGGAPQPTDDELIETIADRFLHRATYRIVGGVEMLLAQNLVDVDNTNHGGIRWYQLARIAGFWVVAQQGDHAPDTDHRWNASIAMDRDGSIALGYSVSSASTFPSIRYAGRLAGDPLNTLPQGEGTLQAGSSSQNACTSPQPADCRSRWGDYSSMNVDPEDDCTFWYTNEYIGAGGSRRTRIGSFRFCNDAPTADAGGPYLTPEGSAVTLDASGSDDPNPTDDLTYEWDLDNDAAFDDATGVTTSFIRGDNGSFPIAVRVTDTSGASDTDSATVTVTNVDPTVTLDPAQVDSILEGETISVEAAFTDPGWEDTYTATIDWGHADLGTANPAPNVTTQGPPQDEGDVSGSKLVGDDGSFGVTIKVTDDDGGSGDDGFTLSVGNVDPDAEIDLTGAVLINGIPTILSHSGDPVDFKGTVTDPGSDDETLTWDFDDGSPTVSSTSLVNPPFPDPDPSPTNQPRGLNDMQTHTFADACAYEPSFTAEDDDGGSDVSTAAVLITGNAGEAEKDGFWHHQYKERADGKAPKPDKDLTAEELLCYLEIAKFGSTIFDEVRLPLDTLEDGHQVFHHDNDDALSSEQEKLDKELLAAWVNFANGAFDYSQLVVDTDKDHVPDLSFVDAVAQAEAVRANLASTKDELKDARKLLEDVNKFKP